MRCNYKLMQKMADALDKLGDHLDLLRDYVVECYAGSGMVQGVVQWPPSNGAYRALAGLLVECGMKASLAREVASRMSLRQIERAVRKFRRKQMKNQAN